MGVEAILAMSRNGMISRCALRALVNVDLNSAGRHRIAKGSLSYDLSGYV